MPVKIRLQRRGKKGQPFYHLVIADGRAPRDGRFIEKLGTYNPLTHPATIQVDFDRAYHWVMCGAQPTDTARMILKREGIYVKKHLMGGVQKGAFTVEEAEAKLAAWKEEKSRKMSDIRLEVINSERSTNKKRLEAETKVKQAKEAIVAEKRNALLAAEAAKDAKAKADADAAKAEVEAAKAAETAEATETVENVEVAQTVEAEPAQEAEVAETPAETVENVEPAQTAEQAEVVEQPAQVAENEEPAATEETPETVEPEATEEAPAQAEEAPAAE
jgi:small subunit ribosomal protein S16